jgi:restriction system protein
MDPTSIISQFISGIWYFIPIFVIIVFLKTPWFKGWFGESIVNFIAWLLLNKNTYHRIPNVTLPTENGTTQIDHIIVSVYGVFVVETKNMKGWIFGSPDQKTWTQKIYRHTNKFQNPLYQNYKHVKTLQSLFCLKDNQIHSVVVFVGDSTFKTNMPENVTYGIGYIKYVKSKTQQVFSELEVLEIKLKIIDMRLPRSLETNRKHVQNVKNIVRGKENKDTPACPRCGGSMVWREVKKGPNAGKKFWGCSRFPRCKGLVKAKD